ncbi:MAG TPA: hypothetical protein DDY22_02250 [Geobacter sp.]|nr:hypothetical protein [Geobacter sp.]
MPRSWSRVARPLGHPLQQQGIAVPANFLFGNDFLLLTAKPDQIRLHTVYTAGAMPYAATL